MSLLRAAAARPARAALYSLPRTLSSSAPVRDDHHDHHPEDNTVYPQETFMNKVWLGWTLAGLTAVGFYKFAPSPEDDTVVSRFIQYYSTPKETWAKINVKHLLLSAEEQLDVLTIVDAKRPPVHRFRYPQIFEQHSPHLQPVGRSVDLSDLVVKTEGA